MVKSAELADCLEKGTRKKFPAKKSRRKKSSDKKAPGKNHRK